MTVLAVAVAATSAPASAESRTGAAARVHTLLDRLQELRARAAVAEQAYERSLTGVAQAVTAANFADRARSAAEQSAAAARSQLAARVSGLYMSGGPLTLFASALDAGSFSDFQSRTFVVQHIVASSDRAVRDGEAQLAASRQRESAALTRARGQIKTARDVAAAAARMQGLLNREAAVLAQARAAAAQAAAVAAAQQALAQQQAAVATITAAGLSSLQVLPASPDYLALYHSAAQTCPGLSWTVLAAIGQVESGHGRNPGVSSAGAIGPMQFLPATFASYAVDGDHDGSVDIMSPADAVFTAARYLCANGAGGGSGALAAAVWHYNHADWYVQMVLTLARQYADG
jgi:hypothetical protein